MRRIARLDVYFLLSATYARWVAPYQACMLVMKLMYITWNDHAVLTSFNHMHACKIGNSRQWQSNPIQSSTDSSQTLICSDWARLASGTKISKDLTVGTSVVFHFLLSGCIEQTVLLLLLLTGFCCLQITSSRAAVASLLAVLSRYSSQSRPPSSCLSHSVLSVTSPAKEESTLERSAGSNTESDFDATGRGSNELSNSGTDRLSTQGSANAEAAQAAATALQNLLLNKDAQGLVVDLQGTAVVAKLLSPQNWLLAARAAGDVAHTLPMSSTMTCDH